MAGSNRASEAIFGSSDGAFTGLGMILALLGGSHFHQVLKVALPASVAGMMSMAAGVVQADNTKGWRDAAAMGCAWLGMCFAPVLTAAVTSGWVLWLAVFAELVLLGLWTTQARCHLESTVVQAQDYAKTYLIMVAVAVPTIVVALLS